MISPQEILLAAIDIESAVVILFVVLSILGRLLGGKKNNPQRGGQPRPPQMPQLGKQPPPGAGQQAGGAPVGMEEVLRKEVDEFLRRVQGKPPQPIPKPREVEAGGQQVAPRRMSLAQERQERPARKGLARQRPAAQSAVKLRGTGVSEHVDEHIRSSTHKIGQHAQHLGEVLAHTDERMEDRLRKKFDHRVGRLQHQEADKVEANIGIATEIAEMLSKPAGMRQMIIASEILRRPFD